MTIWDIFKKRKKKEEKKPEKIEKKEKKEEAKKPLKVEVEKKPRKPKKIAEKEEIKPETPRPSVKISKLAYRILKAPHVTEKATDLAEKNQYVFKVWPKVNKTEIKKAIEDLYGVDVMSVRVIKIPKKQRRLGRITGWRKGYKKAIVKVKKGQKIEVLPR